MKVLLVSPPTPFLLKPLSFPPLGLLYLASALEQAGHEAIVADMSMGPLPDVNVGLVGITACTPHVYFLKNLISECHTLYDAPIILGGPHFSAAPRDAYALGAHMVCSGDGERSIVHAADFPMRFIGHKLEWPININEWPSPARHLLDLWKYHYTLGDLRATNMLTSRGCPYACDFCTRTPEVQKVRYLGVSKIEQEVETIKHLGFKAIVLYDDELNILTSRLASVCQVFKEAKIRWRGFFRSNLFDEEQAKLMAESGCWEACFGLESASDKILRIVHKREVVADTTRARKICKDFGIRMKVFTIIGLPGETEETVEETRQWLLRERPDDFDICPFCPYPGSRIFTHLSEYDIKVEMSYWDTSFFHKGVPGEYHIPCSTSALTSQRIGELRDSIELEVRQAIGMGPRLERPR